MSAATRKREFARLQGRHLALRRAHDEALRTLAATRKRAAAAEADMVATEAGLLAAESALSALKVEIARGFRPATEVRE